MEFDRGQVWWVSLDPTQGSEIQKTRFSTYIETLSSEDMGSIEAALRQVIGL